MYRKTKKQSQSTKTRMGRPTYTKKKRYKSSVKKAIKRRKQQQQQQELGTFLEEALARIRQGMYE